MLSCVEVNSSFYRPHQTSTYARWRDSTPPEFRFSVKMPRTITHELRLADSRDLLIAFLEQTDGLREKRGPILVQLPPSFAFDAGVLASFLNVMRSLYQGAVVWEPRHPTWFSAPAEDLLQRYRISRVAADPPPVPEAARPAGDPKTIYFRLHGSPRMYWSRYDQRFTAALAAALRDATNTGDVWCVFDNTASGAAIENACELVEHLSVKVP